METKELSQYYYLKKEIADIEGRIMRLEARASSTVQTASGMPGGGGGYADKTSLGADIAELRTLLLDRRAKAERERIRLEKYIASVQDSRMRLILTYRFVDLRSWQAIACRLGSTAESVKKAFYRSLAKSVEK